MTCKNKTFHGYLFYFFITSKVKQHFLYLLDICTFIFLKMILVYFHDFSLFSCWGGFYLYGFVSFGFFFSWYSHLVYSFEGHSKVKFLISKFSILYFGGFNGMFQNTLNTSNIQPPHTHTQFICIVFYYFQSFIFSVLSKQNFCVYSILYTAYTKYF